MINLLNLKQILCITPFEYCLSASTFKMFFLEPNLQSTFAYILINPVYRSI